jgi:hypothetical protein
LNRCVRAPIVFEDIPLSSNVASDEMFERAVTAVRRNGVALKGIFFFFLNWFFEKQKLTSLSGNISSQNTSQSLNVLLR